MSELCVVVREFPLLFPFVFSSFPLRLTKGGFQRPTSSSGLLVFFCFSLRLRFDQHLPSQPRFPNCAPSGSHKLYASSTPSLAVTKPLLMRSAHGGALISTTLAGEREREKDEVKFSLFFSNSSQKKKSALTLSLSFTVRFARPFPLLPPISFI